MTARGEPPERVTDFWCRRADRVEPRRMSETVRIAAGAVTFDELHERAAEALSRYDEERGRVWYDWRRDPTYTLRAG